MKRLLLTLLLGMLFNKPLAIAQSGFINFEEPEAYLGHFAMDGKPIKHRFAFFVAGENAVTIDTIEADCACSVVHYDTSSIASGQYGFVEVAYDPYGPGPFKKTFVVSTPNGVPKETTLSIEGFIEPEGVDPKLIYPAAISGLYFKHKTIFLGTITNKAPVKKTIQFFNPSDQHLALSDSVARPEHIEIIFENGQMFPGKSAGSFAVYYHPEIKNDWGTVKDSVTFYHEGKDGSLGEKAFTLPIAASIRQYFSPEEVLLETEKPQILFDAEAKALGDVDLTQPLAVDFVVYNQGKKELKLLKVIANYGCDVSPLEKRALSPGEKTKLTINIFNIGKKGGQDRSIIIYSNDPVQPVKKLTIKMDARKI